MKGDFRMAKRR